MTEQNSVSLVPEAVIVDDTFGFLSGGRHQEYAFTKQAPASDSPDFMAYAAEVTNLTSKADVKLSEVLNEKIELVHVFAHRVRIKQTAKDSGEISYLEATRTVLVDASGMTYEAVSEGAMQGIAFVIQLFGAPSSWKKPVPVAVKQIETKSGNRTFSLVVVDESAPPKGKGKKGSK